MPNIAIDNFRIGKEKDRRIKIQQKANTIYSVPGTAKDKYQTKAGTRRKHAILQQRPMEGDNARA